MTPEPPKPEHPTPEPPTPSDELEVLAYERVTNDDGSQIDIAVVNMDGNEVGVIDANLDGRADFLVCDVNLNGTIDEGEAVQLQDQVIEMAPLQDAAGFNPLYAQNDIPDYVNDADVDTFMA